MLALLFTTRMQLGQLMHEMEVQEWIHERALASPGREAQ